MIKRTIRTPIAINAIFLLFLLIPVIFFSIGRASASPLDNYCQRQFELSFMQKLLPVAKKCESRFKIITDEWYSGLYSNK